MDIRNWLDRLFMRVSYSRWVDGLWLGSLGGKDDEYLLRHVEDALMLIKRHDVFRYRRILRDVERIWVCQLIGARGRFNFALKTCYVDRTFVGKSASDLIASTIVHEAAHAHPCLHKMGYAEELRYRIERICMRRELAFARLLPDSGNLIDDITRSLSLDASVWSNKEFARRRPAAELEAARAAGMPDWLTKLLLKCRGAYERVFRVR